MLSIITFILWIVQTVGFNQTDLCGNWQPNYDMAQKCEASQGCFDGTTFITSSSVLFASDGTYLQTFRMATGNCPFDDNSGVVIMAINTIGNYSLEGNNTDIGPGFYKIKYTPSSFHVALKKNQKKIYYTHQNPGDCQFPVTYWNTYCPCNSTWDDNAVYNSTTGFFDNARVIVKGNCPNNTCNETFFLSNETLYGNIQFSENNATGIRTVNLTVTDTNSTLGYSYGPRNISYTFISTAESCQPSITPSPSPSPSPHGHHQPASSDVINICNFMIIGLILWLKLINYY